jgi:hypothetical protein
MLYLPALIAAAVLVACAAALLAISQKANATFPGKNGHIAYSAFDFDRGPDDVIYTIDPGGGAKTKVTRGYQPSFSPEGKKMAYTVFGGADTEIYTIKVGGGGKFPVTHTNNAFEIGPSWGSRP